ncbi:cell adhesion molecule CEACAM21-like [Urocitellus parryii]
MQPPSACPCRGGIPWQGVLLAVLLLTFWNLHPTAKLTIEPVPFDAAEGTDVLLLVHNVWGNTVGYAWYRGQITDRSRLIVSYSSVTHSTTQGPAFSGRETIYPNGSLLFMNVTKGDTGFYTLQTTAAIFDADTATRGFRVHGRVAQPSLRATNTEPHSVAMTCLSGDPGLSITWILNSQTLQLTDSMQLSPDHRTLTIDPVRQEDAGEYQCEASNPISSNRSDRYRLAVISEWPRPTQELTDVSEDRPQAHSQSAPCCFSTGLVAQPSLRATNTEPHSVAMTCLSGGPGLSITWILNSQTLQLTDRMQLSPDHRTLRIDPVRQEDAGEYQCEASNPISSNRSDHYRLAVISEERTPGLLVWAIASFVTGVLVGVALVAALRCFLVHRRTGRLALKHMGEIARVTYNQMLLHPYSRLLTELTPEPPPSPQCP